MPQAIKLRRWHTAALLIVAAGGLLFTAGWYTAGWYFGLSMGVVNGTVTLDDRPEAGVRVCLAMWTEEPQIHVGPPNRVPHFVPQLIAKYETISKSDGTFQLTFVRPGRYAVGVGRPDEPRSLRAWAGQEKIEVAPGVKTHDIWLMRLR
jgi:hypothetical protein